MKSYTQNWQNHIDAKLAEQDAIWNKRLKQNDKEWEQVVREKDEILDEQRLITKKTAISAGVASLAAKSIEKSR